MQPTRERRLKNHLRTWRFYIVRYNLIAANYLNIVCDLLLMLQLLNNCALPWKIYYWNSCLNKRILLYCNYNTYHCLKILPYSPLIIINELINNSNSGPLGKNAGQCESLFSVQFLELTVIWLWPFPNVINPVVYAPIRNVQKELENLKNYIYFIVSGGGTERMVH